MKESGNHIGILSQHRLEKYFAHSQRTMDKRHCTTGHDKHSQAVTEDNLFLPRPEPSFLPLCSEVSRLAATARPHQPDSFCKEMSVESRAVSGVGPRGRAECRRAAGAAQPPNIDG